MNKKLNFIDNVIVVLFIVLSLLNSGIAFYQGDISEGLGWFCAFNWCLNCLALRNIKNE
jgi:hypothetical protein